MREKAAVKTLLMDLSSSLFDDDSSPTMDYTANCLHLRKEKFKPACSDTQFLLHTSRL